MLLELKVPEIGESVTEVEIGDWLKQPGEVIGKDEPVVTLDSEKATVDLPAPDSGTLTQIFKKKGEVAKVGEVIAQLEKDGHQSGKGKAEAPSVPQQPSPPQPTEPAPAKPKPAIQVNTGAEPGPAEAAARTVAEARPKIISPAPPPPPPPSPTQKSAPAPQETPVTHPKVGVATPIPPGREEETVPMSRLRRSIAERLVQAQRNAALLTTFNEIDMSAVQGLRKEFGEMFNRKYNAKLGFMSFFVKACIDALKQFPAINAELRGSDVVYHNYYDIGVAIGGGKGLVVPVLRNAERMSFAEIELAIGDFARRAKENKVMPDELQGGTFTISNGGVYGSLLSTPIINPPQSGVLGMHAIQDRPVARDGAVVIRPMMYVALTYDHRIVDGREAVTFLKRLKDAIDTPARLLMEV